MRIALNLKGIDYEQRPVSLVEGDQQAPAYRDLNPQGFVPMLEIDGHRLTQSLAIMRLSRPEIPRSAIDAGRSRRPARMSARWRWRWPATSTRSTICACSNICRARSASTRTPRTSGTATGSRRGWRRWRKWRGRTPGAFLFGDAPTIADICLVPQLYNARRFSVPLTDYPTLRRADETASAHAAFAAAHPDRQEH